MKKLPREHSGLRTRFIERSQIPASLPLHHDKGYWDSVIQRLKHAPKDQVLEIAGRSSTSVKSSLHRAATRLGKRVEILIREPRVYVWITGDLPQAAHSPRLPIKCPVCGKTIARPKYGGSKQIVHAGRGRKKSECQKIWRYKQAHPDITMEDAKEQYRRRHGMR